MRDTKEGRQAPAINTPAAQGEPALTPARLRRVILVLAVRSAW